MPQISSDKIHAHLTITQSIIQRMATNSASSKTWCITLVSAILVIVADKGKPNFAFITLIPIVLFFFLDAYYLALEKCLIGTYNKFIGQVNNDTLPPESLYKIEPTENFLMNFIKSICSPAVFPFYSILLLMLYITYNIVIIK